MIQHCRGVEVRRWAAPFSPRCSRRELVIEAFACELPRRLCRGDGGAGAQAGVDESRISQRRRLGGRLPRPAFAASAPAADQIFFLSRFYQANRRAAAGARSAGAARCIPGRCRAAAGFWRAWLEMPGAEKCGCRCSAMKMPALPELLAAWAAARSRCLPGAGRAGAAAGWRQFLRRCSSLRRARSMQRGNLHVHVLPFVEQERYDELLWACDAISCAARIPACGRSGRRKPFVWQIYPQHDGCIGRSCTLCWTVLRRAWRRQRRRQCRTCGKHGIGEAATPTARHGWDDFAGAAGLC